MASQGGHSAADELSSSDQESSVPRLRRAEAQPLTCAARVTIDKVQDLSYQKRKRERDASKPPISEDGNIECCIFKPPVAFADNESVSSNESSSEHKLSSDSASSLNEDSEMPQPRIIRRYLAKMPDTAPVIYDVGMLDEPCPLTWPLAPCARLLAWVVWVADLLFMLNLIPGDSFRPYSRDPTITF